MKELIIILNELGACEEAMEWLSSQTSIEEAWKNCERGDWLLWLITALKMNERKLFLAKGLIADEVIHQMDDERSKAAVQAAIDFGKGKISKNELKKAIHDAAAAAYIADDTTYAAAAAAVNIAGADVAANAAVAYAAAVIYATNTINNDNEKLFLKKSANIVRKIFSFDDIKKRWDFLDLIKIYNYWR